MATMTPQLEQIAELDVPAFAQIVDSASRYFLRMSGEEFTRRWEAGEFPDPDAIPGVMEVLSLLPSYHA